MCADMPTLGECLAEEHDIELDRACRQHAAECLQVALKEALPALLDPRRPYTHPYTTKVMELMGMQAISGSMHDRLQRFVRDMHRERHAERDGEPLYLSDVGFLRQYPFHWDEVARDIAEAMTDDDLGDRTGIRGEVEDELLLRDEEDRHDAELRAYYRGPRA